MILTPYPFLTTVCFFPVGVEKVFIFQGFARFNADPKNSNQNLQKLDVQFLSRSALKNIKDFSSGSRSSCQCGKCSHSQMGRFPIVNMGDAALVMPRPMPHCNRAQCDEAARAAVFPCCRFRRIRSALFPYNLRIVNGGKCKAHYFRVISVLSAHWWQAWKRRIVCVLLSHYRRICPAVPLEADDLHTPAPDPRPQ